MIDQMTLKLPTVQAVLERDRFARLMGIKVESLDAGKATVSMLVEENHLNGVDIAQGGALFALADFAFALATNSHGITAVGIESSISFFKPSRLGDKLHAEAIERYRSKSLGAYDVQIKNEKGVVLALFHGRSFFRH